MNRATTSAFDLPERLAAKADPELIAADEHHFATIGASLAEQVAELEERLAAARRAPARSGQAALDRDQEVHRLSARLRTLRRYGLDLCLGRMVDETGLAVYVGRLGLTDRAGRRLLVDWRSPAAEPFFGATRADPMRLVSRRRYRWTAGRVVDYWDEAFTVDGAVHLASLDDESAFLASLGGTRTARMRDVLGTIQSDQDAIIRAGSRGALVVDGGPGTGKTVVALHRAAYLLYSEPRLSARRGGVLVVGPSDPYLAYVSDVLPSLGEEGVLTCTLRDLVPEGPSALPEPDPEVARLKASAAMVEAIEPAVRFSERPPTEGVSVETEWADVWLSTADWAEAFAAPDPGTPHNEAREQIWDALVEILVDKHGDEAPADLVRRSLTRNRELTRAFNGAWPVLEPTELVGDLWSVPAYLRLCAPWLTTDEVRLLQRDEPARWTTSDLPLLDAARLRLGDPEAGGRRRRQEATRAAEREYRSRVVDDLIASDDSEMLVMTMLRGEDLQSALDDDASVPTPEPDRLAGPFAHVVVDEAQELTDAEWQMLIARCPSRSLTVVGDRAQARHGFTESWHDRLERVGLGEVAQASLTINYRTPAEVMAEAEPVIRAALPDANVPTSVRTSGVPVRHARVAELDAVVGAWLEAHDGVACVVGAPGFGLATVERDRVRSLTPELVKGLEFDLVVLVDPAAFGDGVEGAVDRYVAMTRATERLVVLTP
ncbi:RNA polymerase recycling motor ATPase HelR [Cellulomonas alba]|uniref:RNA polymerase recycling motor ATPase HelR n=1 Tax=Cellulomonas alba TaxID=3053467 RepID=A0ABT7SFR6_9CELL|nr:RNA polymerase recycling motor ATPase HelR [Cellulomonas alba]MDM7854971.1 RNA polymerase recycling motor ATPase HelR [Cellulomonas alba]